MTSFSNLIPTERRSLRANGTGATVASADAANAGVVLFTTNTGTVTQGTVYPIGTTLVAPVGGSGNWLNAVTDANMGSVFKFNRRGIYKTQIYATGTLSDAANAQLGITLDCLASTCVIGTSALSAATVGLIDFYDTNSEVGFGIPSRPFGIAYITDTLAGGAQPVSTAGVFSGGVGVLRFHATTGAGAVVATAFVVASIRAEITAMADLAG